MIEIALIALKFAALIVGGVFAAIGLLTDYRDKTGRVTKWGKTALFGIILSTIIGAGSQAVESYRDRMAVLANDAANRKSEEQTQVVLGQIKRAIYPLRDIILVKAIIEYPTNTPSMLAALKSVDFGSVRMLQDDGLPFVYHFDRGALSYPKTGILLYLFEPTIYVRFWKKGKDWRDREDLSFSLPLEDNRPSLYGEKLEVDVHWHKVPNDHLVLSHGMVSLEDMRDGRMHLAIGSIKQVGPVAREDLDEVFRQTRIDILLLSVANHLLDVRLKADGDGGFHGEISILE